MSHCWERNADIIVGDQSYIYLYQNGGAAVIANVFFRIIKNNQDGTFDLKELKNIIITHDHINLTKTRLICIENAHNLCYGVVLPLDFISQVINK